ncbi:hypothetical protein, partial [Paraliomyxa miuraensis]|uniref:hypothetical protein n=1 Tax=Paraliomyxa miuraensis TaxID=376150 RepID=UPI00224EE300
GEDTFDVLMSSGAEGLLSLIPGGKAGKRLGDAVDAVGDVADAAGDVRKAARGVPNPHGSRGGPAHRGTIERRIDELRAQGHEHVGGGSLPEEVIPTPGGCKTCRRPDITTRAPDGSVYRENVGRSTQSGEPIARERRGLDDIEAATGTRPGYTPYDR